MSQHLNLTNVSIFRNSKNARSNLSAWALKIIVAQFLWAWIATPASADDDARRVAAAAIQSYKQYLDSFKQLKARYTWKRHHAANSEAAFRLEFQQTEEFKILELTIQGTKQRLRESCKNNTDIAAVMADAFAKSDAETLNVAVDGCLPHEDLVGDSFRLGYSESIKTCNIHRHTHDYKWQFQSTPFNPGAMGQGASGPIPVIEAALDSPGIQYSLDSAITVNDELTIKILSTHYETQFRFKPSLGYALSGLHQKDVASGLESLEMRVIQFQEQSKGRWFPQRSLTVFGASDGSDVHIHDFECTYINADYSASASDFQISLAPRTQVSIRNDKLGWFYTSADSPVLVHVDQIPDLHAQCVANGERYYRRLFVQTYLPYFLLSIIAGALIVFWYLRRRKVNSPS